MMDSSGNSRASDLRQVGVEVRVHEHSSPMHRRLDGDCMGRMFKSGLLCDVVLVAQQVEIHTHKFVLASASTYFYWLFVKDKMLGRLTRINLDHISHRTLSQIVSYLYRGQISITEENVADLLSAACSLVLRDLQLACRDFLANNLTPENCVQFGYVARQFSCEEVCLKVKDMVRQHISAIVKQDQFLLLSYEQVTDILSVNGKRADQESLLDCILRWVSHDLDHRQKHVYELMKIVHFPSIPLEKIIQRFDKEHWLKVNPSYGIFITDILKCCVDGNKAVLSRNPSESPKVLIAAGISTGRLNIEMYDFEEKIWVKHSKALKLTIDSSPIAITGSGIYCFHDGKLKYLNFNKTSTARWIECNQFSKNISLVSMAVLNNSVYIIGYEEDFLPYECPAYKFDISSEEWTVITHPFEVHCGMSLGSLNGRLYSFGGYDFSGNIYKDSSSVECYNIETDSWCKMPSMTIQRKNSGAGTLDGMFYVVGGGKSYRSKTVEVFNPNSQSWKRLPDTQIARRKPGVIGANGQLYVIGGSDINGECVEVYYPTLNTWCMLPSSLNTSMSDVVVVLADKSEIQF